MSLHAIAVNGMQAYGFLVLQRIDSCKRRTAERQWKYLSCRLVVQGE